MRRDSDLHVARRVELASARCRALAHSERRADFRVDTVIGAAILDLLVELQRELGVAHIFISHDFSTIKAICDELMILYVAQMEHATAARCALPARCAVTVQPYLLLRKTQFSKRTARTRQLDPVQRVNRPLRRTMQSSTSAVTSPRAGDRQAVFKLDTRGTGTT